MTTRYKKQSLEYCFIGSAVGCAVAALLALLNSSVIFFVIDGVLGALVFMFCYQTLQKGDYKTARTACLGVGVACGVLGLVGVLGNELGGLIGLGVCGALLYGFTNLSGH